MKTPILQLTKNLRRTLMQGNPWVYSQALSVPKDLNKVCLAKLVDSKKEFLCWGVYNPESPLAFRVLSFEKQPPSRELYEKRLNQCLQIRNSIKTADTNGYRLINGEGDSLPGIICDIYKDVAVIQFDGNGPYEFWDHDFLAQWLLENIPCQTVYYKPRHDSDSQAKTWGQKISDDLIEIVENGVKFLVDVKKGQKTGFFLDQRENRNYIKNIAKDKSLLNLFSYSGGFSVYAGCGEASKVVSVDIAQGALDLANKNWQLNLLDQQKHETICADVFEFLKSHNQKYDIVICDPPSMAKSEKQKEAAINKYIETFAQAAKLVPSGGHLVLSSCSSHISFEDFQQIISSSLSKARKRGQILKVSGQGPDHPYPHACFELRYLKFVDLIIN